MYAKKSSVRHECRHGRRADGSQTFATLKQIVSKANPGSEFLWKVSAIGLLSIATLMPPICRRLTRDTSDWRSRTPTLSTEIMPPAQATDSEAERVTGALNLIFTAKGC